MDSLPPGVLRVGGSPDYLVAVWKNVMILHIRGSIDDAFLKAAMAGHNAALRYDPEGYGVIGLVDSSTRIPPSSVRDEASRMRTKTQHMLRAQSFVIGGEGFFASTLRAVLTGIMTIAQTRVPTKNCATDADASAYVVERACALGTNPDELAMILRQIRSAPR